MPSSSALVITSISAPNSVLNACATGCQLHEIDFIVVGDVKSPADFTLDGCDFWGIKRQRQLAFNLSRILPEQHYARKNLGYLIAMERGAEVLIETDDDNTPFESFWQERQAKQSVQVLAEHGWVNVYQHFSDATIWPRGFPLEFVHKPPVAPERNNITAYCPIQQGLADGDPDVDAVYRLIMPLPISFRNNSPIALGRGCWSPFNSQNTTWFKPAFPLLYIPSFCSFRMCDIWRSFVAQRICWENDWHVMFHKSTVFQERNEHELLHDFRDEIPGYLNNTQLCQALSELDLRGGVECLSDDLKTCYELLIKLEYIGAEEMPLVNAWIEDVSSLI